MERELDLKFVLYYVCKRWRSLIVVGLIFAMLLCGYKTFNNINAEKSASLNLEIENTFYDSADDYSKNSILYNINPLDVKVARFTYAIDIFDNDINDIKNLGFIDNLIELYRTYVESGSLSSELVASCEDFTDVKYADEIITFKELNKGEDQKSSNSFEIKVISNSSEFTSKISSLTKNCIDKQTELLNSDNYHFNINLINDAEYSEVDLELKAYQDKLALLMEDEKYQNKNVSDLLLNNSINTSTIGHIKSSIKYVIIGFILGVFLLAVFYIVRLCFSDCIVYYKDLKLLKYNIIALIPDKKSKYRLGIDKLFAKLCDCNIKTSYQVSCSLAESCVEKFVKNDNVVIVNCIKENSYAVDVYNDVLGKNQFASFAGNILYDAEAIKNCDKSEKIIILIKLNDSTYSELVNQIDMLNSWGKKICGILVSGVETNL